jgi:hypothetical protein
MSKVSSRLREVINLKPFSMIKGNFLITSGINGLIFRIIYPLNMLEKVEI